LVATSLHRAAAAEAGRAVMAFAHKKNPKSIQRLRGNDRA